MGGRKPRRYCEILSILIGQGPRIKERPANASAASQRGSGTRGSGEGGSGQTRERWASPEVCHAMLAQRAGRPVGRVVKPSEYVLH